MLLFSLNKTISYFLGAQGDGIAFSNPYANPLDSPQYLHYTSKRKFFSYICWHREGGRYASLWNTQNQSRETDLPPPPPPPPGSPPPEEQSTIDQSKFSDDAAADTNQNAIDAQSLDVSSSSQVADFQSKVLHGSSGSQVADVTHAVGNNLINFQPQVPPGPGNLQNADV